MSKITQLSTQLSNMIAAGEVVEGPYSVVKELVENSIDANAKKIEIYLKSSGISSIEVIDDGEGMDLIDARLCFSRHATSKIKNEGDLFRISSLGFRGEAIPSVASVAHFDLYTKQEANDGINIKYEFGSKTTEINFEKNPGTRIIVDKLFFNTPARLKYLKSENSILASIASLVTKLSIAHPSIAFKLMNNNEIVSQSYGKGNMRNLLANIYGVEIVKNMMEIEKTLNGMKIEVYFAKPEFTRSRKNEITTIVNERFVKSNLLINAIVDAYKPYIPFGRYPICVIKLTIDPLLIDVNVHPSKMDLKFSLEDVVYNFVKETIDLELNSKTLIAEHNTNYEKPNYFVNILENEYDDTVNERSSLFQENNSSKINNNDNLTRIKEEKIISNFKTINNSTNLVDNINNDKEKRLPYLEYVGAFFGTYLIFQNELGIYLIDQHAAQERIKYEYYYNYFANPSNDSINLLIPKTIDLTVEETLLLSNNLDKLKNIGLGIEPSGPTSFLVRYIPTWLKQDEADNLIEKIISFLIHKNNFDIGLHRDSLAKMVSCKESIKANHYITREEAESLYNELKTCNNPFTCPHGRPSIVKLSAYEIEKMFKRVV